MRIVVAEYPKSGGTWLVNLLGDALDLPKRDIYVDKGFKLFDISRHPWYEGEAEIGLTPSCVIKSHELPGSPLHDFDALFVHLIRDGRDVVVSKYYYEKEFCVRNRITPQFTMPLVRFAAKTAREWARFVRAWIHAGAVPCRYESLLKDTAGTLRDVLVRLGFDVEESSLRRSVEANTRERMRKALDRTFEHNTFVRKGIAGEWRNVFDDETKKSFKFHGGEILVAAGYERDNDW